MRLVLTVCLLIFCSSVCQSVRAFCRSVFPPFVGPFVNFLLSFLISFFIYLFLSLSVSFFISPLSFSLFFLSFFFLFRSVCFVVRSPLSFSFGPSVSLSLSVRLSLPFSASFLLFLHSFLSLPACSFLSPLSFFSSFCLFSYSAYKLKLLSIIDQSRLKLHFIEPPAWRSGNILKSIFVKFYISAWGVKKKVPEKNWFHD